MQERTRPRWFLPPPSVAGRRLSSAVTTVPADARDWSDASWDSFFRGDCLPPFLRASSAWDVCQVFARAAASATICERLGPQKR